jgi:hypothetical protein
MLLLINNESELLNVINENSSRLARENKTKIERAIEIIKIVWPRYYNQLSKVARRIVLFQSDSEVSFATRANHGTVFINVHSDENEIYFYSEFIHQFSHVLLYALTADPNEYFNIDYRTPLAKLNHDPSENRSLYSAFHGLFTTNKVALGLEALYDAKIFSGVKEYEVIGRLVDNYRRLNSGIEKISNLEEVLTPNGCELYNSLYFDCTEVYKRKESLVNKFEVLNQPFVFSFDLFLKENPLIKDTYL